MRKIIECMVWCVGDENLEQLGLESGDSWMPFAVDFSSVIAIKECGETDFLGKGRATIYFANEHVTIDILFVEAIEIWKTS